MIQIAMLSNSFVENVADATTDDVPMMVFADVRVEEVSDAVYRCFTTGMKSLGFHELEVDETTMEPDELLEFFSIQRNTLSTNTWKYQRAIPLVETTISSL